MKISGKIKSVGVKNKLDSSEKADVMILDLRLEVFHGQDQSQDLLELIGKVADVDIVEQQMSLNKPYNDK